MKFIEIFVVCGVVCGLMVLVRNFLDGVNAREVEFDRVVARASDADRMLVSVVVL